MDKRFSNAFSALSSHHNRDPAVWLKHFAFGVVGSWMLSSSMTNSYKDLFQLEYVNNPSLVWSFDDIVSYEYNQSVYDGSIPYDDSNYKEILAYGEGRKELLDLRDYELLPTVEETSSNVSEDNSNLIDEARHANHPL
jgi:hypothetical protein